MAKNSDRIDFTKVEKDETVQDFVARTVEPEIQGDELVAPIIADDTVRPEQVGTNEVEDLIHDSQGNVRHIFSGEGIGTVTNADAINALVERVQTQGRFMVRERDGGHYDVYSLDGKLLLVGADEAGLRGYIHPDDVK